MLPWVARLSALAAALGCVAWLVGRVWTDASIWTQYLWWIPTWPVVASGWVLLLISSVSGRLALRLGGVYVRPVLLVGLVGISAWLVGVEWRLHRLVLPVRPGPGPSVRVLHWNMSSVAAIGGSWDVILRENADVALVFNPPWHRTFRPRLVESLREATPRIDDAAGRSGVFWVGDLLVATHRPLVRYGHARLRGLQASTRGTGDTGRIVFLEFDVADRFAALGRPLVVWAVDLPSEPALWRHDVFAEASRAVERWEGPAMEPRADGGGWMAVEAAGVPEPDLIIGDFNAPAGSWSLRRLVGSMAEAHAEAGVGDPATWPRRRALWHIDLAFVSEAWRVARYDTVDPGITDHRLQVVELSSGGL